MSGENEKDRTIFSVGNNHGVSCGEPPRINGDMPGRYCGYFENEFREQFIFVYNYDTQQGTLWVGDAGWENPQTVVDGKVPKLVLGRNEALWLQVSWDTAVALTRK